jgi:adenine-specific DNA-methyltransferase
MSNAPPQQIEGLLLDLLPADGAPVGNRKLFDQVKAAAAAAGVPCTEQAFAAAREALVAAGRAARRPGRGGATARIAGPASVPAEADRPDFALQAEATQPDLPLAATRGPAPAKAGKPKRAAPPPPGAPQVLSYRHADRRVNNPEVGLVSEASDPAQPRTAWAYDPHLDPVLQWAGKAERTSFEVDTVSLHVHERIDPMSILAAVGKARSDRGGKARPHGASSGTPPYGGVQPGLFEAPFESLPLRDAVDFYRHDKGWSNRLVAGDSLLVMNSLLVKEGLAGQVQMIYIDPPYGIRYGSNFQPFVNKRDVKDRADADLTAEPEMIKAFRDTWELGIHSYLTYLRDRLLLARELLSETGSVFVQISDENLHHVRELMDEIFQPANFCALITVAKTASQTSELMAGVSDYLVWYAKDIHAVKFWKILQEKTSQSDRAGVYRWVRRPDLSIGRLGDKAVGASAQVFRIDNLTSQRPPGDFPVEFNGVRFGPGRGYWKTGMEGMPRLIKASRIIQSGSSLAYRRYLDDFPAIEVGNLWTDTGTGSFTDDKVYVVQTAVKAVQRCLLMTTDPGDLVLDPTCGSGTTAYVAEKWGRRWITCDTSRVAVTLAKTRLMTASYDYYELRYPHEGLKGGFIYKTVPHVTLKSIANNPEIDSIHERLHPAVEQALAELNAALQRDPPAEPLAVTEGVRKGQKLALGEPGVALHEWEVPFPAEDGAPPAGWPAPTHAPFAAFHAARRRLQAEMDRSIAAHADSETLYDQPEKSKNKLRITGPFSVEAVPFPTVLSLDSGEAPDASSGAGFSADAAVARSGATSRHAMWRDELLKTGIRGRGGQTLKFSALDTLAGTTCLHCSGTLAAGDEGGEPAVVSFGPEHGALEQRQVEHAIGEAAELFPRPKFIVFCAFAFDPEAAKDIDAMKGITALKAQMNTDLLTEDLKKARAGNQSFWLMGQPDVLLLPLKDGRWQVEVNGFDYFDTVRGELVSGGKSRIALWSLDTDYDGRSLFPHQVFFPMAGKGEGWEKLKKDIRAELDESRLDAYRGTVSLPFEAGAHRRVAVKIVDDRGIESLKVMGLPAGDER